MAKVIAYHAGEIMPAVLSKSSVKIALGSSSTDTATLTVVFEMPTPSFNNVEDTSITDGDAVMFKMAELAALLDTVAEISISSESKTSNYLNIKVKVKSVKVQHASLLVKGRY